MRHGNYLKFLIFMFVLSFVFIFNAKDVNAVPYMRSTGYFNIYTPVANYTCTLYSNTTDYQTINSGGGTVSISGGNYVNHGTCNSAGQYSAVNTWRELDSASKYRILCFYTAFDKGSTHASAWCSANSDGGIGVHVSATAAANVNHGEGPHAVFLHKVNIQACDMWGNEYHGYVRGSSSFAKNLPSYWVGFNGNGATSGVPDGRSVNCGEYTYYGNPSRTGYSFAGWSEGSPAYVCGGGKTITAYWNINSYRLTAYANSGSISSTSNWSGSGNSAYKNINYGSGYGNLPNVSRTGYRLKGWFTSGSGGSQVSTGTTIGAGNASIYAQWNANTYTVKYNANGSTDWPVTGSMSNSSHTYDQSKALNNNNYSRRGYTFLGWSRSASATTASYGNQASVRNLTATHNATVNLYAVWQRDTYIIHFNGNGATGTMADQRPGTIYYHRINSMSGFVKEGFTFIGWAENEYTHDVKYTNNMEVYSLRAKNKEITLYAVWRRNNPGFKRYPNSEREMFADDSNALQGGDGTAWDSVNIHGDDRAHVDKRDPNEDSWEPDSPNWADKSLNDPGYFTIKDDNEHLYVKP